MNEYSLIDDATKGVAFLYYADTNEDAIALSKIHVADVRGWGTSWKLYLVERDDDPEIHNVLDASGPLHEVFVHKFSFDENGILLEDYSIWDESLDISLDSGTAGDIIIKEPEKPVDDSGTANE
jgi:hypothetical protein